jgi:hypothetical protein
MNPLLGPKYPLNGFVVSTAGIALLVITVLLGAAGLGKGPFASRLRFVALANIATGALGIAWTTAKMGSGAALFLRVIGGFLIALGLWQLVVVRNPRSRTPKHRASPAELRAAIGVSKVKTTTRERE